MKIAIAAHARSREISMLPMINIIFLLLVFVILTGGALRAADEAAADSVALVVRVTAEGDLQLQGKVVTAMELSAQRGGRELQLQADASLAAARLLPLLESLRAAGIAQAQLRLEPAP